MTTAQKTIRAIAKIFGLMVVRKSVVSRWLSRAEDLHKVAATNQTICPDIAFRTGGMSSAFIECIKDVKHDNPT